MQKTFTNTTLNNLQIALDNAQKIISRFIGNTMTNVFYNHYNNASLNQTPPTYLTVLESKIKTSLEIAYKKEYPNDPTPTDLDVMLLNLSHSLYGFAHVLDMLDDETTIETTQQKDIVATLTQRLNALTMLEPLLESGTMNQIKIATKHIANTIDHVFDPHPNGFAFDDDIEHIPNESSNTYQSSYDAMPFLDVIFDVNVNTYAKHYINLLVNMNNNIYSYNQDSFKSRIIEPLLKNINQFIEIILYDTAK